MQGMSVFGRDYHRKSHLREQMHLFGILVGVEWRKPALSKENVSEFIDLPSYNRSCPQNLVGDRTSVLCMEVVLVSECKVPLY